MYMMHMYAAVIGDACGAHAFQVLFMCLSLFRCAFHVLFTFSGAFHVVFICFSLFRYFSCVFTFQVLCMCFSHAFHFSGAFPVFFLYNHDS